MPMYNLTEYRDNNSKTYGFLEECYRDAPNINNNGVIIDFLDDSDSASFKSMQKITG